MESQGFQGELWRDRSLPTDYKGQTLPVRECYRALWEDLVHVIVTLPKSTNP